MALNDATGVENRTGSKLSFIDPESYIQDYSDIQKAEIVAKIQNLLEKDFGIDLNNISAVTDSDLKLMILTATTRLANIVQEFMGDRGNPRTQPNFKTIKDNQTFLETWFKSSLEDAAEKDDFEGFIKLKLLYPPGSELDNTAYTTSLTETELLLRTAWSSPYCKPEILESFIDSLNESVRHLPYSNTVALVQSSGAGKSRLVWETAKVIFTLPFNIADAGDGGGSNALIYPFRDADIAEYLTQRSFSNTEELEIWYYRFFIALFECVTEEINMLGLSARAQHHEEFAKEWADHMESNRETLYKKVIAQAEDKEVWKILLSPPSEEPAPPPSKEPAPPLLSEISKGFQLRMTKALSDLLTTLVPPRAMNKKLPMHATPVKLILYFDEAQPLVNRRVRGSSYYYSIMRCINAWAASCAEVIVIFLSTNTKLSDLAPSAKYVPSARLRKNERTLQAPLVETPFDCSPEFPLAPGLTLRDVSSPKHLARFGRPLWWSLHDASQNAPETQPLARKLLDLARAKLLGVADASKEPWVKDTVASTDAAAAVLDTIINIDFGFSEAAVQRQDVLVKSHMRLIYSVPQSREYMHSGSSSEPVLAEAALYQMWLWTESQSSLTSFVRILEANTLCHIPSTMIDPGERGEVVARALIMIAYIRAVCSERQGIPDGSNPFFSLGCTVIGFVEALFTDEHAKTILDSVPCGSPLGKKPITFREKFKNSYVRFTHWVRAADDSAVTAPAAMAAFVRGMAMIGHPTQAYVDLIIPILLDRDGSIESGNITAFLWQIKARKDPVSSEKLDFDEAKLRFFSGRDESGQYPTGLPYVMVVSELGLFRKNPEYVQKAVIGTNVESGPVPATPPRKRQPNAHIPETPSRVDVPELVRRSERTESPSKHPKYKIIAKGCSENIYKVIKKDQRSTYEALVGTKPLFHDHPRRGNTRHVYGLKPVWVASSYRGWFADKNLVDQKDIPWQETVEAGTDI